MQRTTVVMSQ